jgi:hypothetical protein
MSNQSGIPKAAAIAINDLLDNCVGIKPGMELLLMAHLDGLYGSDNLVDREAISWLQSAIHLRGAHASVLWLDEVAKPHAWRFPPVLKAAISACDMFINHSFDIVFEEMVELKQYLWQEKKVMVRNFATTAPLLCTDWAQTPHQLVSEIRYQASLPIKSGLSWQLTADNGTHLEGKIEPAYEPTHPWFTSYSIRREEGGAYRPFPEWVHPPINLSGTTGVFVFDCMLSWWSRYIGISPYFSQPVWLNVKDGRITDIKGGTEADALRRFLAEMKDRLGEGVYDMNALHFGVHPQAHIEPHQCPNLLYRRLIEHAHTSNIHIHIGAPHATEKYPYWMHCTGDIRTATFKVGDTLIHDRGHLTVLDSPAIKAMAAKYPGRPGLLNI